MAITCPKCQAENPETKQFCADCGTRLTPAQEARPELTETLQTPVRELTTGSSFAGRYQIIEELGHGGMGKVYRVLDKKLNEEVALKLIKPEIDLPPLNRPRYNEKNLKQGQVTRSGLRILNLPIVPSQDQSIIIHR